MAEYIERGYPLNGLSKIPLSPPEVVEYATKVYQLINGAPAADVVEVVRCKDCINQKKFFQTDKRRKDGGYWLYFCDLEENGDLGIDNDFCSRGVKKEGDADV